MSGYMSDFGKSTGRKNFKVSTKKIEWNKSAGRDEDNFKSTSKCRQFKKCGIRLKWGSRMYEFDHKDNNNKNNSQKNCYLVCRNCHGKATVVKKKKVGILQELVTYKKKVGYKKSTKPKKKPIKKKKKKEPTVYEMFYGKKPKAKKKTVKKKTVKKKTTKKKPIKKRRKKEMWE